MSRAQIVILCAACLLVGCEAAEKATAKPAAVKKAPAKPAPAEITRPAAPPAAKEMTLEVETFKLREAEAKELPGASGGKAVLFSSETSGAETTVELKKGTYDVTVYMQASSEYNDAFYMTLAGVENRLFPDDWGKLAPTETITVTVPQDGPRKLTLEAAETGYYIDRVVLKPVK